MRIAIDTTPLLSPKSGIGRYTFELLSALRQLPEKPTIFEHYGIHRRKRKAVVNQMGTSVKYDDGVRMNRRFKMIPNDFKQFVKKTLCWIELAAIRPDIFHATNYVAEAFGIPTAVTVCDLAFVRYAETFPADRLQWLEKYLPQSLSSAGKIITISEFTKKELIDLMGISQTRIETIHLGVDPSFTPRKENDLIDSLQTFNLTPKGYILSVGTLEPRKNITALLAAYETLPYRVQNNWPLVVVGMRGWKDHTIAKRIDALVRKGVVRFLGYIPDDMLPRIYAGAKLFVFPSLYEGFGLPLLEAMACGVPTLASNRASLPEIGGNAPEYINPEDTEAMADVIQLLLNDTIKYNTHTELGLDRARQFTWQKCAENTYGVYRKILSA